MDKTLVGTFIDAAVNDHETALRLLNDHPTLRQARWIHGETVLHFLAVEGYAGAVQFLAGLGFGVNLINEFGDAPLVDVATLGNDGIAEVLLKHGADPNAASSTRDNVLHCAVRSGNARLVELLLAAGARLDYVTDIGESVFDALPDDPGQRKAVLAVLKRHGAQGEAGWEQHGY